MTAPVAPGTLYLVPNLLGLVAPEAVLPALTIARARQLRRFVVESPKPARQFLKSLQLDVPIATLAVDVLPQTATADALHALLAPAQGGEDIGVLSDAGCPGVADPGAGLVAAAHREGVRVVPLVGPSALLLGLMASGMNGQRFTFHGYLPVDAGPRAQALRAIDADVGKDGGTHLFIETPYRNEVMVEAVLATCRPGTQFCVAADLTLPTEWIRCAAVAAWWRERGAAVGKRPALFLLGRPAA